MTLLRNYTQLGTFDHLKTFIPLAIDFFFFFLSLDPFENPIILWSFSLTNEGRKSFTQLQKEPEFLQTHELNLI